MSTQTLAAPRTIVHATFVPFASMTARQQAEHLVYAHGFDVDYFGPHEEAAGATDAQLVDAWATEYSDAPEREFLGDRTIWHNSDHDEYPAGEPCTSSRCQHTHERALRG